MERARAELRAGRITLREALAREAALVRLSRPEALAALESRARIDPAFAPFVHTAHAHGAWVGVVSAGIRSIIGPALERAGVDVPVFANDVDFDAAGWRMTFIDDSALGHDKAARVRAAPAGARTVYVGDGISDFEGALAADVRFAKKAALSSGTAESAALRVRRSRRSTRSLSRYGRAFRRRIGRRPNASVGAFCANTLRFRGRLRGGLRDAAVEEGDRCGQLRVLRRIARSNPRVLRQIGSRSRARCRPR